MIQEPWYWKGSKNSGCKGELPQQSLSRQRGRNTALVSRFAKDEKGPARHGPQSSPTHPAFVQLPPVRVASNDSPGQSNGKTGLRGTKRNLTKKNAAALASDSFRRKA